MKTVHEVSRLTGVSVRALHHYDEIGLLRPAAVTPAGYRLYDEASLMRLQEILLFRESGFSLQTIRTILDSPSFDRQAALADQLILLERQKERVERMIALTRKMIEKGTYIMDFEAFDKKELDAYAAEAQKRWGDTAAYAESKKRAAGSTAEEQKQLADGLTDVFRGFGELRDASPASPQAQAQVAALRDYITDHYYTCTDAVLSGLGEMYAGDERFRRNIDEAGGEGTALFAAEAIRRFVGDKRRNDA